MALLADSASFVEEHLLGLVDASLGIGALLLHPGLGVGTHVLLRVSKPAAASLVVLRFLVEHLDGPVGLALLPYHLVLQHLDFIPKFLGLFFQLAELLTKHEVVLTVIGV